MKIDRPRGVSSDGLFCSGLMEARQLLSMAGSETTQRYREALKSNPIMLTTWRELSACYAASGMQQASLAALESGSMAALSSLSSRDPRASEEKYSCAVASPLRLQMAVHCVKVGRAEEGLAFVGDAFRAGKGGAAGHVVRGFINLSLGNDSLTVHAFKKAKEVEPAITGILERLASASNAPQVPAAQDAF